MGGILISKTVPLDKKTKPQVRAWYKVFKRKLFRKHVKEDDSGGELIDHRTFSTAYTGDFATFHKFNISFLKPKFGSRAKAMTAIDNNSEKWGGVIAAQFYDSKKQLRWVIGGVAAI